MQLDFSKESVPDATTLTKFRHILEENHLGEKIFADVRERLDRGGMIMHGGTIVDATIVSAPSSTKNKDGERDPEMHQTKKGNQWHYGMKVHIGADAGSGYVHTITGTAANVHDIEEAPKLFREDDHVGYGDSGYLGIEKRDEVKTDPNLSKIEFRINKRPSSIAVTSVPSGRGIFLLLYKNKPQAEIKSRKIIPAVNTVRFFVEHVRKSL